MARLPRPSRRRRFEQIEQPADKAVGHIAEIVGLDPAGIEGYMVVAVTVDGSHAIAHNGCCLPHMMGDVALLMVKNPELTEPRVKPHGGRTK